MLFCVSDWAWIALSEYPKEKLPLLKGSLTIQPRRTSQHQEEIAPIHLYTEKDGWIGLPRSYFLENQKLSHDIKMEMARGRKVELAFDGELKGDQGDAVDRIVAEVAAGRPGGIVQAAPGWGKTVVGIAAWLRLKTTCLVVVQREYLLNQWRVRIKGDKNRRIKGFAPDARVGVIQGDRCEYGDDYDISIATIQTLVSRRDEYPDDFWSAFGLVTSDETHRIGAPSWAQVIPMFKGFYRLGLTATPRRKDGADNVFFWHIGPIVFKSKDKKITPRLRRVYTGFRLVRTPSFDPNLASKEVQLRQMCANPVRNRKIVDELLRAAEAGRKVLVLSERRKHLERLRDMFGAQKPQGCTVDFYVGGREQRELDTAEKADVVFATYQMAKEALDIPALDTLFLTTPVADVEQAVGRIMREYEGKKNPVITDFIDRDIDRCMKLWNSRRRFYIQHGMYKEVA